MAMTKKEQARLDDLEQQLREARALRFTEDVKPDVPPPENVTSRLSTGWLFNSYLQGPRVEPACSSYVSHGSGQDTRTTTQGARCLFSTRLLALRAMRRDLEQQCAKILARVDQEIEKEGGA